MKACAFSLLFITTVCIICLSVQSLHGFPEERTEKKPVELGKVRWLRDLEEGKTKAKTEKKPVLIMFQEVPG